MKYDLTSGLIFFRPVMKVKYINKFKANIYYKTDRILIICIVFGS